MNNFRETLERAAGISEERVEVNQRHLIDKILARYSSEFTVFRELIQNSNDALSGAVEIIFAKKDNDAEISSSNAYTTIVFKNDGRAFSTEDWNRLKKIAEGNPDEDKIGFFGVGFYSLFSICEEPVVISSDECMAFFWKGDQLYAKRAKLSSEEIDKMYASIGLAREMGADCIKSGKETSFILQLRDPCDLPDMDDFGRFLATSLLFTRNLSTIKFFDHRKELLILGKKSSPPEKMQYDGFQAYTPNRLFKIKDFSGHMVQLDVDKRFENTSSSAKKNTSSFTSFLLRLAKIEPSKSEFDKPGRFCLFMRIIEGTYISQLGTDMINRMERTTKKKPPSQTTIQLMFTNYEQFQASDSKNPMLKDLIVYPEQGKVFIGFATHQTTGCTFHLAAQVIPTVERESIDFVDPTLNIWNQELLYACGMVIRNVYENELSDIIRPLKGSNYYEESQILHLFPKVNHLFDAVCFHESTPHSLVSRILLEGFLKAYGKTDVRCLTSHGMVPISMARIESGKIGSFLKNTPLIPRLIVESSPEYFKILRARGMLVDATIDDIINELSSRRLETNELISVLKWWIEFFQANPLNLTDTRERFLRLVTVETDSEKKSTTMAKLKYYTTPNLIAPELPVDLDTLSLKISKHFSKHEMERCFNLQELHPFRWCRFIIGDPRFLSDLEILESSLFHISRLMSYIDSQQAVFIYSALAEMKCIITKDGSLQIPRNCYLPSVKLVDKLPIVSFQKKRISDEFLIKIGVRSVPSLELIFENLGELKWDNWQLIKYLTSIKDQMSPSDKQRLKEAPLFEKVGDQSDGKKYRADELFFPNDELSEFGFPIISWKTYLKPSSDIGEFLLELGLQLNPPLHLIIGLIKGNSSDRMKLFSFLTSKQSLYQLEARKFSREEFLPLQDSTLLASPLTCYSDVNAKKLEFFVLDQRLLGLARFFGIKQNPSGSLLVEKLLLKVKDSSCNAEELNDIFQYLSTVLSEFTDTDLEKLKNSKFIPLFPPVEDAKEERLVLYSPDQVFFKAESSSDFEDVFVFVDFGPKANSFLYHCGVKREPSVIDLANELIKSPMDLLEKIGSLKYLGVLKKVAVNVTSKSSRNYHNLMRQISRYPCLLGQKSEKLASNSSTRSSPLMSPQDTSISFHLASSQDIYLNDDSVLQQLFNPLVAPADSVLEDFYEILGCKWLSKSVTLKYNVEKPLIQTRIAAELEKTIRDRALLLLYDSTQTGKSVRVGAQVILESVKVFESKEIRIEYTFGREVMKRSTTACMPSNQELIITGNFDFFDVSSQVSKVIYETPRLSDNLLFSTLLSSSLFNLQSKGFPVDRILRRYKEAEEKRNQVSRIPKDQSEDIHVNEDQVSLNNAESSDNLISHHEKSNLPENEEKSLVNTHSTEQQGSSFPVLKSFLDSIMGTSAGELLHNVASKVRPDGSSTNTTPASDAAEKSMLNRAVQNLNSASPDDIEVPARQLLPRPNNLPDCCEIISAKSLSFFGEVDGVKVFYKKSSFSESHMVERISAIKSFSVTLKILAGVFGIGDFTVLNIFYDSGRTIAFNRNCSLFFNLYYYETKCSQKSDRDILIYWYLTFCHELAHNFIE